MFSYTFMIISFSASMGFRHVLKIVLMCTPDLGCSVKLGFKKGRIKDTRVKKKRGGGIMSIFCEFLFNTENVE